MSAEFDSERFGANKEFYPSVDDMVLINDIDIDLWHQTRLR